MGKKWFSLRSIAAAVRNWLRPAAVRQAASEGSLLPTTGTDLLGDPDGSVMKMRWRKSYECGHPVIDRQHCEMFDLGNQLINAVLGGKPRDDIESLLDDLVLQIQDHFTTEEDVLARTHYPLTAEHKAIHRDLLERAGDLQERYLNGRLAVSDLVGFIAYDVIASHIIQDDQKFALRQQ